jgi:uncharacterized membrane protein YhaH (DUF805 family)
MNSFISLYNGAEGRIGRKNWWLGVIGLAVAGIVLTVILSAIGLGPSPTTGSAGWGQLIVAVLFLYPSLCLSTKRRHDRDNNGMDIKIVTGVSLVLTLLQTFGVGMTPTDVGGVMVPMPAVWLSALYVILGLAGLYLLVVLGFLRGTVGTNAYGADPTGGNWAPAA